MSGLTTLRDDDGSATITTAGLIVALILVRFSSFPHRQVFPFPTLGKEGRGRS